VINIPSVASYTYDAENHLLTAGGVTYTYDGDGKRVMKSNGTIFWYGAGSDPLVETDAAGNLRYEHYYFNGRRVKRYEAANGWVDNYTYDPLGNANIVYGDNGGWDWSVYYPFGGERVVNGYAQVGSPWKFTGKERDSESGLDNFETRYFGSSFGRFMSPDAANIAGDLDESGNPQSWNAYAYVRNNPVNAVDPNGEDCVYAGDFKNSGTVLVERGDHCSYASGSYVEGHIDENSFVYDQKNNQLTYNVSDTGASGVISVGPSNAGIGDSDRFAAVQMGVGLGEQGVNWATRTTAENAVGALGGYLLGRGIQAIVAAREAAALAEGAVDLENISSHITRRMASRGWTKQAVVDTIKEAQQAGTTYSAVNKATGGAATEYVNQSTGRFVVVDNTTKQIIQVSGPGFRPNYMAKP
jgi:RHS repeat-associated protein